jgi:hypothetical protein
VEHGEEADLGAEMSGIGRDGLKRLGHGAKQDGVHEGFVLQRDHGDRRSAPFGSCRNEIWPIRGTTGSTSGTWKTKDSSTE